MKEVFLLKAGNAEMFQTGTSSRVLKNGDFFEIRDFISTADHQESKRVPVIMLHTHPYGFTALSQDDVDTLTGMRLGLDRDFIAGIVLPYTHILFDVKLVNKAVYIEVQGFWRYLFTYHKAGLKTAVKKLVRLSNYE